MTAKYIRYGIFLLLPFLSLWAIVVAKKYDYNTPATLSCAAIGLFTLLGTMFSVFFITRVLLLQRYTGLDRMRSAIKTQNYFSESLVCITWFLVVTTCTVCVANRFSNSPGKLINWGSEGLVVVVDNNNTVVDCIEATEIAFIQNPKYRYVSMPTNNWFNEKHFTIEGNFICTKVHFRADELSREDEIVAAANDGKLDLGQKNPSL